MGSNWSSLEPEPTPDLWWPAVEQQPCTTDNVVGKEDTAETPGRGERGRVKHEELESFKQELARKRAQRHEALAALQTELKELRRKVDDERCLRLKAEEERDNLKSSTENDLRAELKKEMEEKKKLIKERESLMEELEQKEGLERQVQALKDVSEIGKEMLRIRELQVKELKKKLVEINLSSVMAPPEDLRIEYEKQIENIRKLRTLYEERAAATLLEHRRELEREEARITVLEAKLSELQKETEEYKQAKKELEDKIETLESTIQKKEDELETTKDDLFSSTVQNKSLNTQMKLINNLFSHMLVSPKVDLDRLTHLLKENHDLITDLTSKGDSNEVAALLVDLAGQVEKEQETDQQQEESPNNPKENVESQSEIASNLTKVWRVMVELLSHHQNTSHSELSGGVESCYKCIQTPTGPRSVISVSQTFLTLKDLILEKNRLVKEVGRLKTLNNHLENRLGSQEKRLSVVTTELKKTWGIVNKLRAQHKQLHTHEKILRYELQQKRCMLTELKQELEHCRDKWERARQKNSQTEEDWKKLRKEFAARKSRKESNSAESGYEEEDVAQSPPSEPSSHEDDPFKIRRNDGSEPELSEEDIEHSDGNSFDTVIDLLDIACLETQNECGSEIPFVLCEVPTETTEIPPTLLPLTGSEFTEGLDQIESADLAAVLDIQYQNQLLGADYNLSLPSSSGSSPIPTENDDIASSEMDISEEDSSSVDNHIYSSPLPIVNQLVPEETLLFGSNSSTNISKFMDGLFFEQQTENVTTKLHNLILEVPSTSQIVSENESATPLVNNENCYQFPAHSATPKITNDNCYLFPLNNREDVLEGGNTEKQELPGIEHVQEYCNIGSIPQVLHKIEDSVSNSNEYSVEQSISSSSSQSESKTQEEILKAREDRLRRLEQQCRSLVSKVTSTSFRSEVISNKLDGLHLYYGSSEEASDGGEEVISQIEEDGIKESYQHAKQLEEISSCNTAVISSTADITSVETKHQGTEDTSLSKSMEPIQTSSPVQGRTAEQILEARAARLKRLESQCKSLFSKMSATSSRSQMISNKLDELHSSYGPSDQTEEQEQPSTSKESESTTKRLLSEKNEYQNIKETNETRTQFVNSEQKKDLQQPDLVSESKEILNKCSLPGPSTELILVTTTDSKKDRTAEEILEARSERFKRLEEQCKSLVSKMTATSLRSEIISNKLDELHSCYGSSEDTSDNEEFSKESDKRRFTPTSSPRFNKKMIRPVEKDQKKEVSENQNDGCNNVENVNERVTLPQKTKSEEGNINIIQSNPDSSKRSSEEILQARAQRLNRLEEQCKSLFSKMSATSQRSDIISNRLEELHGQYGQPSTSQTEQYCQSSTSAQFNPLTTSASIEAARDEGVTDKEEKHSQSTNSIQSHIGTKFDTNINCQATSNEVISEQNEIDDKRK